MIKVIASTWALLLGLFLLQVGNGLQGTLIGVRGGIEGFSTFELSIIVAGYFLGFLGGSKMTPEMIRRVGHVRVFAALGSFISATLILYPAVTEPWAWSLFRVILGFCLSGVYVTAESWLNNASTNETRGQALSAYMIVQTGGIIAAQGLVAVGDPADWILFVIASVLVSVSFAPILLSVSPTPPFEATRPMTIWELYRASPLGMVGMTLLGAVFAAQFGMASVYGTEAGLSVGQISALISIIFVGAVVLQYPVGWISDRMDRRVLICACALVGGVAGVIGWLFGESYQVLLAMGFVMGGISNPLYALLIAYTNDYLDPTQMAGASGALIFVNGVGAILGPIFTGWTMAAVGPHGFWLYMGAIMAAIAGYALWRMTRRASAYASDGDYDAVPYAPIVPSATPVALEVAQDIYAETAEDMAGSDAASEKSAPERA